MRNEYLIPEVIFYTIDIRSFVATSIDDRTEEESFYDEII